MKNLTEFVTSHLDADTSRLILDRKKYPMIDMDLAVSCIESRRKLKGKVQEWYDEPGLIFPRKLSAEQCSSSQTGRYKSEVAEKIVRSLDSARDDIYFFDIDNMRYYAKIILGEEYEYRTIIYDGI